MTRYLLEYVALMPQGKLNLSQRVAFLTDAPEIEAIQDKIRLLLLLRVQLVVCIVNKVSLGIWLC